MERVRTASQNLGGTLGVSDASQYPVPIDHASSLAGAPAKKGGGLLRVVARVVRNAAIAVALMTTVPIAIVGLRGDHVWRYYNYGENTHRKTVIAERARSLSLPKDASITPRAAGQAFNELQNERKEIPGFTFIQPASRPEHVWATHVITAEMFPTARPNIFAGPDPMRIMEAVQKGFSPQETEYLKAVGTADAWKQFDLIARAPAADFVGGTLRTDHSTYATWYSFPVPSYKTAREMAYASVSRAAYHMSQGRKDSAEAALRSAISVGFALIDNSTSLMDQLIGDAMVSIGRDALGRFYQITNDPRASSPAVAAPPKGANDVTPNSSGLQLDEMRQKLIQRVNDPTIPRGERLETLRMLSVSSCTNVKELMFGPSAEVRDAMDRARRELGRYPSERALIDLSTSLPVLRLRDASYSPLAMMVVSPASVAGVVLRNPRLGVCSVIAAGGG